MPPPFRSPTPSPTSAIRSESSHGAEVRQQQYLPRQQRTRHPAVVPTPASKPLQGRSPRASARPQVGKRDSSPKLHPTSKAKKRRIYLGHLSAPQSLSSRFLHSST